MPFISPLLQRLASEFHRQCGVENQFPLDIESAILRNSPLSIVKLSSPGSNDIKEWFAARGILTPDIAGHNRPVFGCTVLYRGKGFIFIDGMTTYAEQRFTLAHEFAHYLRDYYHPRNLAIEKLGPEIIHVLNADRPLGKNERIQAVLVGVPLRFYTHLMARGLDGGFIYDATGVAETAADRLALELIAPYRAVLRAAGIRPSTVEESLLRVIFEDSLTHTFDLPWQISKHYAYLLANSFRRRPSITEWLGL